MILRAPDAESGGGGQVERVTLLVEAPAQQLQSNDSGLNVALRKLTAVHRMLGQVEARWRSLLATARQNPFPRPSEAPLPFYKAPDLFTQQKGSPAPVAPPTGQKVPLAISGDDVSAYLSGKVNLVVPGTEIVATLAGKVQATLTAGDASKSAASKSQSATSEDDSGSGKTGKEGGRIISTKEVFNKKKGEFEIREQRSALDDLNETIQTVKTSYDKAGNAKEKVFKETRSELGAKAAVEADVQAAMQLAAEQRENETRSARGNARKERLAEAASYRTLADEIEHATKLRSGELNALERSKRARQVSALRIKETNALVSAAEAQADRNEEARRIREERSQRRRDRRNQAADDQVKMQKTIAKAQEDGRKQAEKSDRQQQASAQKLRREQKKVFAETTKEIRDQARSEYEQHKQATRAVATSRMERLRPDDRHGAYLVKAAEARSNELKARQLEIAADRRFQAGDRSSRSQRNFYGKEAARFHREYVSAMQAANRESMRFGKNMIDNALHVTQWATSVFLLYGSLRLLRASMSSVIDNGYRMARLEQVFRGPQGQVKALSDDVMRLASINGRSVDEAMESAIQWSRMGLDRVQINMAVRTSLIAANVAEMTAAEATENLTAIMQAYKLKVSELPSVLGELNQISNTYNVTNKQMLQGISRVAGIAAQAKIPLVELASLIGAGVGASGQSGTNFGNAIKAMTVSLGAPSIQKLLREDFSFEVTADTGDLKDMSSILSELFVKYQQLTDAERQVLLFDVGGKFQASRIATLMDNYIRSQVLAVQAMLNLNSAEEENIKIKETLKAQLAAISAEWDRFVNKQARIGGGASIEATLRESAKAFANILRVANTDTGSTLVLGLGAAFAAMNARLALTAWHMDKFHTKSNIALNTVGKLKSVMNDFRLTLAQSVAQMGPLSQRLAGGVKVAADGTAVLTGRLGTLRAMGVTAVRALGPLVLIYGALNLAMRGWNEAMEKMGLSSDTANDQFSRLTAESERYSKASEAAAVATRLVRVAQESIKTPRFQSDPSLQERMLSQVSEIAFPSIENDDERKRAISGLQSQFSEWVKLNDQASIHNRLQEISAEQSIFQARMRRKELEATAATIRSTRAEIARLEAMEKKKPSRDRRELITAQKTQLNNALNKQSNIVVQEFQDNESDLDASLKNNEQHLVVMEKHKAVAAAIGEIYDQLAEAGGTRLDRINMEVLGLQAIEDHWKRVEKISRESLKRGSESGLQAPSDITEQLRGIRDERQKLMDRLYEITLPIMDKGEAEALTPDTAQDAVEDLDQRFKVATSSRSESLFSTGKGQLEKLRQARDEAKDIVNQLNEIGVREVELERASVKFTGSEDGKQMDSLRGQARDAREEAEKARVQREGLLAKRQAAELMERRSLVIRLSASQSQAFAQGESEAERLINQYSRLTEAVEAARKEIEVMEQQQGPGIPEQVDDSRVRMISQEATRMEALIRLHERLKTIEQERAEVARKAQREFERSLLGSGPAELLRKLTVSKLGDNPTAGQLFSLDTGARQDFFDRTGFFDRRRLRDEEAAARDRLNREGIRGDGDLANRNLESSRSRLEIAGATRNPFQNRDVALSESAKDASEKLGLFSRAVVDATQFLQRMIAVSLPTPATTASAPSLAQSTGIGSQANQMYQAWLRGAR